MHWCTFVTTLGFHLPWKRWKAHLMHTFDIDIMCKGVNNHTTDHLSCNNLRSFFLFASTEPSPTDTPTITINPDAGDRRTGLDITPNSGCCSALLYLRSSLIQSPLLQCWTATLYPILHTVQYHNTPYFRVYFNGVCSLPCKGWLSIYINQGLSLLHRKLALFMLLPQYISESTYLSPWTSPPGHKEGTSHYSSTMGTAPSQPKSWPEYFLY